MWHDPRGEHWTKTGQSVLSFWKMEEGAFLSHWRNEEKIENTVELKRKWERKRALLSCDLQYKEESETENKRATEKINETKADSSKKSIKLINL